MNTGYLRKDVEELLPEGSAFILVVLPFGEEVEPTFVTNADPNEAIEAMRAVVKAKDLRDAARLN